MTEKHNYRLIILNPFDIPVYVEYGGADLGFVTKDILMERGRMVLELLELDFGKGRLVLAGLEQDASRRTLHDIYRYSSLATNYPSIGYNYFSNRAIPIEIITVNPPVELALKTGVAELILTFFRDDFSGNNIIEVAKIFDISNLVIANKISFKKFFNKIHFLIRQMKELLENKPHKGSFVI